MQAFLRNIIAPFMHRSGEVTSGRLTIENLHWNGTSWVANISPKANIWGPNYPNIQNLVGADGSNVFETRLLVQRGNFYKKF